MRVIISGGGTGGHIYPALSIIKKIKEKEPNSEVLFIGTHNRMEKEIVPKHNIPFKSLEMIGFNRKKVYKNVKTIYLFLKAIKEAKKIISEFKPDIVIGVGGYVTAPVIYAANKLGIKTLIHEQNSVLGLSNRFLSKYPDKIALSFKDTLNVSDYSKTVYTGNPVSEDVLSIKPYDKKLLGFHDNKKLILIVMGSLGSVRINNKMKSMITLFNNRDEEVLFITGNNYYDEMKTVKVADNIKIIPYFDNMSSILKSVDLIISRAGATTISEFVSLEIPSILIPSPHVTDNHQFKNAKSLADNGAVIIIEEKDLEGDILIRSVDQIIKNKKIYNSMKSNLRKLKVENSATKIYEIIKSMLEVK